MRPAAGPVSLLSGGDTDGDFLPAASVASPGGVHVGVHGQANAVAASCPL